MNIQSSSQSDTESREKSTHNSHISLSTQPYSATNSGKDISWQSEGWQVVDIPGTIGTNLPTEADASPVVTAAPETPMTYSDSHPASSSPPQREAELMSLIRDLNECNDVLLDKVAQLEEALDKSQTALQSEIDHNHGAAVSESRTLSDRHIAQMVTELEVSTQSLKRHQVLNETLQAELATNKDRVAQLDQECAQLQQTCADQSQRLLQAESSVRDLRARLQRQQRYTLQFKAALEKCLNVSSGAQAVDSEFVSGTVAATPSVAMPKVDNIAPWASREPSTRLDPQLEALIRGEHQTAPTFESVDQTVSPSAMPTAVDSETEAQLWRDLARVIEIPEEKVLYDVSDNVHDSDDTELMEMPEDVPAPAHAATAASAPIPGTAEPYLPAMAFSEATPAPVVYPLRTQKRVASLAAVDLPMFPRIQQPKS